MRRFMVVLWVVTFAAGSVRADDVAVDQLVKNARYWQERGRADKAVDAWRRVLLADPANAGALVELGTLYARQGRLDKTREILGRLRAAHPGDPGVARIEQALATGSGYDELLGRARAEGRAGRNDEAIKLYRQAFGGDQPPDDLVVEYYQTLGGTRDGWEPARLGLMHAAQRDGAGSKAELAYAKHLTYRDGTRREGIVHLAALAREPAQAGAARPAWRQALIWLVGEPGDDELYAAYLALAPDDAEIVRRREEARRAVPPRRESPGSGNGSQKAAGFEALERSDTAEAKRIFDGASRNGRKKDPEILTGMGVVALKQQEFARAKEIFEQVKGMAPDRPELWERSLASATFWTLFREAETLRKHEQLPEAEAKLRLALTIAPEEASHAQVMLGDVLAQRGERVEGEALLREVLVADPQHVAGLRALSRLLASGDRLDEALALNDRLAKVAPDKVWPREELGAEALRARAARKQAEGAPDEARELLQSAREADPKNIWVLHDLAGLLLEMDQPAEAGPIIEELSRSAPELAGLTLLRVRQLEAEGHIDAALRVVEGVPGREYDERYRATRARLEVASQIATIVGRARRGALASSRLKLVELQKRVQSKPELSVQVALAWADLDDAPKAAALADEARPQLTDARPGLRLALAAVYLRAGRAAELETMLRELASDPTLSPRERNDLQRMQVAHAVASADRLRERGELEEALSRLAPQLHNLPDDPKLLCALGRVYHAASDDAEGRRIFRRVLERYPDDLEAREGAMITAVGLHDRDDAQRVVDDGVRRAPDDPRMHLIAGRHAAMVGEDAQAMSALRRARTLAEARGPTLGAALLAANPEASGVLHAASVRRAKDRLDSGEGNLIGEIDIEIARLQSKLATDVTAAFDVVNRDGFGGFGGFVEIAAPISANIPLGFSGRLGLSVRPSLLDTGDVSLTDPRVAEELGTYGLDPASVPMEPFARTASGASLAASYSLKWLTVDVGSTRLGVPLQTVVGGVKLRHQIGAFGLALDVSRRSVEDSYLSAVGIRDPRTGITWGRILREGARLDAAWSAPSAVAYVIAGVARNVGEHVPDNLNVTGGAGVEWTLYDWDENVALVGVAASYMTFDSNLRFFTLGQGGYFSPQHFIHAGLPVKWRGHWNRLGWEARGDIGINWFREEASDFYPEDEALQSEREMQHDGAGMLVRSVHAGQSEVSAALEVAGRASYQLTSDLEAGLQATYRTADWFDEITAGVYLRLNLQKKSVPRMRL